MHLEKQKMAEECRGGKAESLPAPLFNFMFCVVLWPKCDDWEKTGRAKDERKSSQVCSWGPKKSSEEKGKVEQKGNERSLKRVKEGGDSEPKCKC